MSNSVPRSQRCAESRPPPPSPNRAPPEWRTCDASYGETLTTPGGSSAGRRLLSAADRVYALIAAAEAEPTDDRLLALGAAFQTLEVLGDEAIASGIDEHYVKALVARAWVASVKLLFSAAELVDPREFDDP